MIPAPMDLPLRKRGRNFESGDRVLRRMRNAKQMADEPTSVFWSTGAILAGVRIRKSNPPARTAKSESSQKARFSTMRSILAPRRRMAAEFSRR